MDSRVECCEEDQCEADNEDAREAEVLNVCIGRELIRVIISKIHDKRTAR